MDNKFLLFGGIGLVIIAVLVFVNSPANAAPTATVTTAQPIVSTVTGPSFTDTTTVDALQHEIVSVEQELAMLSAAQNHTVTSA